MSVSLSSTPKSNLPNDPLIPANSWYIQWYMDMDQVDQSKFQKGLTGCPFSTYSLLQDEISMGRKKKERVSTWNLPLSSEPPAQQPARNSGATPKNLKVKARLNNFPFYEAK